jgi:hypothetical protein
MTRCLSIGLLGFLAAGCSAVNDAGEDENVARVKEGVTSTLAPELPATSIPRFQTQLQRFYEYVPNLTRDSHGRITRKEYTVEVAKF